MAGKGLQTLMNVRLPYGVCLKCRFPYLNHKYSKRDWGGSQESAFITDSTGDSDASNPRITHLESLLTERWSAKTPWD